MIVIMGMAGAGKSTQCMRLRDELGYQWLAVGELLRRHRTDEQRAEMMHGLVLEDAAVMPLVEQEMKRLGDSSEIVLDGCPRTKQQAAWLASGPVYPVSHVIHLTISDEVAMERLLGRGREDDTPEAMKKRFAGYHRDIGGVIAEFTAQQIPVHHINADQDPDTVFENIKKALL